MKKTCINSVRGSDRNFASGFVVLCATKTGYDVAREWRVGTG